MNVTKITFKGCFHFSCKDINYEQCWIYIGPAYWKSGYPIIRRHNKNWIASRFVWYFFTGRDYFSKEVHHKCKTRACVNPFHLEELSKLKHRRYHNESRTIKETSQTSK